MELGMVVHFGGVFPGREKAAIEAFNETSRLYGKKLAEGTFTYFEPFLYGTGDLREKLGFWIVKGPEEKIWAFSNSQESQELRTRVAQLCSHLEIEFVYTGERVLEQVATFGRLAEEFEKTHLLVA